MSDIKADDKIVIAKQSSQATFRFLNATTITMCDTKDPEFPISSGTLVDIDSRVFVATAKHCIPRDPVGQLWILPDTPRLSAEGMLGFEGVWRHPSLDVGLLELTPDALHNYLPNKKPCSFNKVRPLGMGSELRLCTLMV